MTARRTPRLLAAGAALLTGLALIVTPSAQAAPKPTRTITDAQDPGAAYDIIEVTARSAPKPNRPAVVVVTYARQVDFGDVVDVWFDLDGDKVPDLHLSGSAFSEYTVHKAKSFTKDGRDISKKDCARLAMAGTTSKIRLFPACVGSPRAYAVSVRSSRDEAAAKADDWAPRAERFTKKVLATTVG